MGDKQIVFGVLFTTLLLLLLVAGIFLSVYILGKQRLQQQVLVAQLELGYEKELRKVETEVGEYMMERFAQELHDNVGHTLTCMRITIENKKLDSPELEQAFGPIEGYLEEATEQLSMLGRSLNTEYVTNIGLQAAIQLEVDRLNHLRRHQVHWEANATLPAMDRNKELMAFRIFQEMVHNSIKHSHAKNIYISLNGVQGLELMVRDDGRGFDLERTMQSPKASGLRNMLKRAQMAGLQCTVTASPGQGCQYLLKEAEKNTTQNT